MKKFTKVLASFCAMAMIFSVFSATVAADEETSSEQTTAETVVDEKEEPKVPEAPGSAEPEEDQDKQEEEPENEQESEKPAEKASEQGAEQGSEKPAAKSGNVSGDSCDIESEVINLPFVPADNAPKKVFTAPAVAEPFANGQITQADIDLNDGKLPVKAGTYTLGENVTVTAGAKVETNDASITIDLNGHTITYTGTESMYVLGRIRGTAGDNQSTSSQSPINWADCATGIVLTINGTGTITGAGTTGKGSKDYWVNGTGVGVDSTTGRGGCVLIELGSKMILNGGTITDFEANDEGGAICASNGSEFIMNGGTITNCKANKGGGAISGQCSSKQQGPQGEDICADITISGGTISNNYAGQLGGGVRINRCNLYLSGGTITNNNVGRDDGANGGGGIEIYKWDYDNVVEISGSPKVFGNKCKGNEDVNKANFYLNSGIVINLAGDLGSAADIHIGVQVTNEIVTVVNTNGKSFDIDSFKSDISSKKVHYDGSSTIVLKPDTDPKVAGYVIGIGGEIYFKTYVDFGSAAQNDVAISYKYYYKKAGGTDTEISKDVTSYASDAKGDYFVIPVESACMTAEITITLTYDNRNTDYETTVEEVANDSVAIDSSYADLVKALLTYGGYAQKQLKINTDKLPVVSGVDFDTAPDYGLTTATYSPASDPDSAFKGGNVSFLSKTEVKFRFLKSALGNGDTAPALTVTYAGGTKTVQGEVSGNYVIYTIKGADEAGFVASRYNESFSFSVGSVSGEYSIYTYLQVINGTGSQPMKNLAQAYYNFAKEAAKIA